jgi:hypothetical protein
VETTHLVPWQTRKRRETRTTPHSTLRSKLFSPRLPLRLLSRIDSSSRRLLLPRTILPRALILIPSPTTTPTATISSIPTATLTIPPSSTIPSRSAAVVPPAAAVRSILLRRRRAVLIGTLLPGPAALFGRALGQRGVERAGERRLVDAELGRALGLLDLLRLLRQAEALGPGGSLGGFVVRVGLGEVLREGGFGRGSCCFGLGDLLGFCCGSGGVFGSWSCGVGLCFRG